MTTVTPTLEFYNGSSWVNITADAFMGTLHWRGGIPGGGPTDRVAAPGTLDVELDNSAKNSGAKLGYYSPDHANCRANWAIGVKLRVTLTSGSAKSWIYRVKEIKPVAGKYGARRVEVSARDYIEEFSTRKVAGIAIQTDKRGDQLLTTLVASMPLAPDAASYGTGAFTFPYALHDEQDENTACLTVLQKISQSELSYIYVDGITLYYQSHLTRASTFSAAATFNDTMTDLELIRSQEGIYNYIKATTYPVDIDTTLSILGSIPQEFPLEPSESKTITLRYTDSTTARRISGTGLVTPVATTDYKMSSVSGDGKSDLNAYLSITPTAGANSLSAVVTNTGSTKGYVNLLQIRGYKVTMYDKVESIASNSTSINAYGERTITYNMPYQNNSVFGQALADEILRRYKDPSSNVSGVSFIANTNSTLMGYALALGISSRITITETATGINTGFFINGYEYELMPGNILRVTYMLERAFNLAPYFTVDDATYGAINGAYLIAPF